MSAPGEDQTSASEPAADRRQALEIMKAREVAIRARVRRAHLAYLRINATYSLRRMPGLAAPIRLPGFPDP